MVLPGYRKSRRRPSSRESLSTSLGLRTLAGRVAALVAVAVVTVLVLAELGELQGELGFARFLQLKQLAAKSRNPVELTAAVENAAGEAEAVMQLSPGNPDALWEITVSCLGWSARQELDPLLRLRLGEKAMRAAVLAVRAAPSDYEPWLWLARTQAGLGLQEQAELCLRRAQELAPPGSDLELLRPQSEKANGSAPASLAGRESQKAPDT